ncbi:hypothetical protein F2Q68_00027164 [Brassica cretica]|uniref:Uncharacterized protein n=2 Tax=Brassica TaxID=3705 RepID=A0A8S9I865_BRACR|nr:hypothetical protein F2Q68_00027164 [Brassica cretica]
MFPATAIIQRPTLHPWRLVTFRLWRYVDVRKCIIDKNAKIGKNVIIMNKGMLLDTQAMKTILIEIPSLARLTSTAASYSKFVIVSREIRSALVAYCPPNRFSDEALQQHNPTLKRLARGSCCLKSFLKRSSMLSRTSLLTWF